jgi:hypothetical protein
MCICEFLILKGANFHQNAESIFSRANVQCQYLFCSHLIRNFYELFQSHESSVLREKVLKSIDNNEIQYIDLFKAFKVTYESEDQVTNAKELRNHRILEYFASFAFREKFVTDLFINLKDKLELFNIGKNKIEMNFPEIKMPSIEKFNLPIENIEYSNIISVESFMEKFREHKTQNEVRFQIGNEQSSQSNEKNLSFSELEELLQDENLLHIINDKSDDCAKSNKAFNLCKRINYYILELERILNASNKFFDFLSQEEVQSFLNLKY